MSNYNTIFTQIEEYQKHAFPKSIEADLKNLRKNDIFYLSKIPSIRNKQEENERDNQYFYNWCNFVKFRIFDLYLCIFNLQVIKVLDQQVDSKKKTKLK